MVASRLAVALFFLTSCDLKNKPNVKRVEQTEQRYKIEIDKKDEVAPADELNDLATSQAPLLGAPLDAAEGIIPSPDFGFNLPPIPVPVPVPAPIPVLEADEEDDVGSECGNGDVELREECDDGNSENGDGCDENCQSACLGYAATVTGAGIFDNGCSNGHRAP